MICREDLWVRFEKLGQQTNAIGSRFCKILERFSRQLFDHISLSLSFFCGLFEFCMMKGEFPDLLVASALRCTFVRSRIVWSGIMTGVCALNTWRSAYMMMLWRVLLLLFLQIHLTEKQLLLLAFGLPPVSFLLKCQLSLDLLLLLRL
jgi:hypothetical protein